MPVVLSACVENMNVREIARNDHNLGAGLTMRFEGTDWTTGGSDRAFRHARFTSTPAPSAFTEHYGIKRSAPLFGSKLLTLELGVDREKLCGSAVIEPGLCSFVIQ